MFLDANILDMNESSFWRLLGLQCSTSDVGITEERSMIVALEVKIQYVMVWPTVDTLPNHLPRHELASGN
jgi:hypothetical protein